MEMAEDIFLHPVHVSLPRRTIAKGFKGHSEKQYFNKYIQRTYHKISIIIIIIITIIIIYYTSVYIYIDILQELCANNI